VDEEKFPARVEAIEREIARRVDEADSSELPVNEVATLNPVRFVRGVAVLEIVGGAAGIGISIWYFYLITTRSPHAILYLIWIMFLLLYALSIAAGILLWRLRKLGFQLSLLTQALQVVQFTHQFLSYGYVVGGAILVTIRSNFLGINFRFISNYFATYNNQNVLSSFTINVLALVLAAGVIQARQQMNTLAKKKILEAFE
jgi:hypothetical protein